MTKCPICATPYEEGSIATCSNCGFDLTPFPEFLGEYPTLLSEREQNQINSVRQMWVKFQNNPQLKLEIYQLQESIKTQSKNYDQEISQLNGQLEQKNDTITKLNNQIKKLEDDYLDLLEELTEKINNLESQKKVIQEESSKTQQTISYLNQQIANVEIEKINFKQELKQEISSLEYQKIELQNQINQNHIIIGTLDNQIQELKTEKNNLRLELRQKKEQFDLENTRLQDDIYIANQTIINLTSELEKELKYHEQTVNKLEQEKTEIAERLTCTIQDLQNANKQLTEKRKQEQKNYDQKLTNTQKEVKQLNQKIDQLQREKRQLITDKKNYWPPKATAIILSLCIIFVPLLIFIAQSSNQNRVSNQNNSTNSQSNDTTEQTIDNTPSNIFDNQSFPQRVCGDAMPTNSSAFPLNFYPVFVNYSEQNLQLVKSNFCRDAMQVRRKNTNQKSIQVGSFRSYERAEQFKDFMYRKIGSGEVGEPNYYKKSPH